MSGEKTEKPTEKRLRQARKDGQVAKTPDLTAWAGVLVASVVLPYVVQQGSERMSTLMVMMGALVAAPDLPLALGFLRTGAEAAAVTFLPLGLGLFTVAIVGSAAQGGIHVATKQFKPQFKRLNPFAGLKRMLGPQGWWEATKTLIKTGILALVAYHALVGVVPALAASGRLPLATVLDMVWTSVVDLLRQAGFAGMVMAAADYAVVRRRIGKQLRMSKQDIKDEHKQSEGDPMLKGAIRSKQMAMGRNRMMSEVAKADVVLVNPTHIAVALRYDPNKGAPRVIAKGAGAIAAKIRERADEHRVPIVQDVPLARTLYRACKVDQEIPAELYTAVARVLAFVMSLKARGSAAGTHRLPMAANAR
ncbi:MAG: EscU/YscU/HrcU family type III secretion system export apparatus switch protein [Actinomycetota bacterium]|nr:EscU/YscU/HrcU family type III secretion system export apparatus switch protein [Actinomycetota bacterium]